VFEPTNVYRFQPGSSVVSRASCSSKGSAFRHVVDPAPKFSHLQQNVLTWSD